MIGQLAAFIDAERFLQCAQLREEASALVLLAPQVPADLERRDRGRRRHLAWRTVGQTVVKATRKRVFRVLEFPPLRLIAATRGAI